MRIQLIDSNTRKPVANTKFQLQIKGRDSGIVTLTTDGSGFALLDDKLNGQQIISTTAGWQGQPVTAKDNLQYYVSNGMAGGGATGGATGAAGGKQKTTTTTNK